MTPNLKLPDGRTLPQAMRDLYRKITYQERMDMMREFKHTEREMGLSRDHARYYVLSGGKLPPVPQDDEVLKLVEPVPGQQDALSTCRSDMTYVAKALTVNYPRDERYPHLWSLIDFLRINKAARDHFLLKYIDYLAYEEKRTISTTSSDEYVSLNDVCNGSADG